jgi:anti-sigma factor RsiW
VGNVVTHSDWELQRERLSAYLDGEFPDAERAALETHLATCEQCQGELAALRQTRALLRALPSPALPRAFTLPAQPAPAERRRLPPVWTRPVQALGGVAAMIGLGLLVATTLPHMAQPGAAGAATTASSAHTVNGTLPTEPVAGADSTIPVYGPAPTSPSYAPETAASQPFPVAPVIGTTLLVGGAAAAAAGSLARRRKRYADLPADPPAG